MKITQTTSIEFTEDELARLYGLLCYTAERLLQAGAENSYRGHSTSELLHTAQSLASLIDTHQ